MHRAEKLSSKRIIEIARKAAAGPMGKGKAGLIAKLR